MTVKDKHLESIQNVEASTAAQLKTFLKENFQNCVIKWEESWDKGV